MQSRRDGGKIRLCQPSLRDCSSFRIPPQDYVPQALTCLECFFSKLPQNRHPERSASRIYRGTPHLMARSRRTPRMPILPMPFGAFQPPKPAPVGPATVFPWGREQETASILPCPAATSTFTAATQARFTLASPATYICASCT